jgi:hypothetical protein
VGLSVKVGSPPLSPFLWLCPWCATLGWGGCERSGKLQRFLLDLGGASILPGFVKYVDIFEKFKLLNDAVFNIFILVILIVFVFILLAFKIDVTVKLPNKLVLLLTFKLIILALLKIFTFVQFILFTIILFDCNCELIVIFPNIFALPDTVKLFIIE